MTLSQRDDYGQISVSTYMKLQIDLFCISEIKFTSLSIEIKKMKFFYQPAQTHFTVMNTRDNKFVSSKILWIRQSIYKICITLLFILKYVLVKYILKTSLMSPLPCLSLNLSLYPLRRYPHGFSTAITLTSLTAAQANLAL